MKNYITNLKYFFSGGIILLSLGVFTFSAHAQIVARGEGEGEGTASSLGDLVHVYSNDGPILSLDKVSAKYSETKSETAPDYSESNLMIYPNPVQDIAIIGYYGGEGKEVQLSVFDMNGKIVHEESQNEILNAEVDFSSLPKGTYFVKTRTSSSIKSEFIIVE